MRVKSNPALKNTLPTSILQLLLPSLVTFKANFVCLEQPGELTKCSQLPVSSSALS